MRHKFSWVLLVLLLQSGPVFATNHEHHYFEILEHLFEHLTHRHREEHRVEIVFDLDGTLIQKDSAGHREERKEEDQITVRLIPFRLAHGAREMISVLARTHGVHLSFFSGGMKWRNTGFLEQLIPQISKNVHRRIPYHVFSKEDLARDEKKDLHVLGEKVELDWSVLIDDSVGYVDPSQQNNHLRIYPEPSESMQASERDTARLENNLVRALGLVLLAFDLSRERGVSLVEALTSFQWKDSEYQHEFTNRREIYQRGLQAMKEVNPSFELWTGTASRPVYPWD